MQFSGIKQAYYPADSVCILWEVLHCSSLQFLCLVGNAYDSCFRVGSV